MTQTYASSFKLKEVIITSSDGSKTENITGMVQKIDYFETFAAPTVAAEMTVVDNAKNIISSLPIQGLENISIKISVGDSEYVYNFKVFKIYSRFSTDRMQTYKLGLISHEALLNETTKVGKQLKGYPHEIVEEVLKEHIGTEKNISVEESCNSTVFFPGRKSPFAIIDSLTIRSIPQSGKSAINKNNKSNSLGGANTKPPKGGAGKKTSEYESKLSGTAGYIFYENISGYHYNSIDKLNDPTGNPPVKEYIQENAEIGSEDTRIKILDIDFVNEIDMMSKLRMGTFSSMVCFYNISTGAYDETSYTLTDSFKAMNHLGEQDGVPTGQAELAEHPTRIMSILIDHETWNPDNEIASPEQKDGGSTKQSKDEIITDSQKHYVVQSVARQNSLQNQKVIIKVPINPALEIGQTVKILIPNMVPGAHKDEDIYDPEHSGVYLISQLTHTFDSFKEVGCSTLIIIRDTYGMKKSGAQVTKASSDPGI